MLPEFGSRGLNITAGVCGGPRVRIPVKTRSRYYTGKGGLFDLARVMALNATFGPNRSKLRVRG